MARVEKQNNKNEKQEKKKVTKGEIALQIGVGVVLLALVVFIVILIVQLVNKTEDEEDNVYENFVTVNQSDLDIIINVSIDDSGRYQDLSSVAAKNLLSHDDGKNIYILFYSSVSTDYSDSADDEPVIENKLKTLMKSVPTGQDGKAIFILFDYSASTSVWSDVVYKLLGPDGQDVLNSGTLNVPTILKITPTATSLNNKYKTFTTINAIENEVKKNVI